MDHPPPITFTGNPRLDWIILIVAVVLVLYSLKAIRLSRDYVRQRLRFFIAGFLVGIAFYLVRGQVSGDQPLHDGLFFGLLGLMFTPKRSRYIPAKVKREVISRDLKGKRYDGRKHNLDHKWPFVRGGGHTADNLRVMERGKNLKKGDKKPGLWDMFVG